MCHEIFNFRAPTQLRHVGSCRVIVPAKEAILIAVYCQIIKQANGNIFYLNKNWSYLKISLQGELRLIKCDISINIFSEQF